MWGWTGCDSALFISHDGEYMVIYKYDNVIGDFDFL